MKKILFLTVLLTFMIGMTASASDTRLETMGMGSFWYDGTFVPALNTVVKDDANITMYPSTINYHPNIFWGEIDALEGYTKSYEGERSHFYKVGALFQKGEDDAPCTFGMHFSTTPYENQFDHNLSNYDDEYQTNHRINLYYGRDLSGMPFGFTLGYYRSSAINENVLDSSYNNQYEDTYNRYEVGFGLSMMEEKLDLALSIAMTNWVDKNWQVFGDGVSAADSGLVDQTEPDGNMEISLRGRYFMEPKGKFTCVPHLAFETKKYGEKRYSNTAIKEETYPKWQVYRTDETKVSYFDLGWGMNYDASEDVLFVTDFGVTFGSYTNSSTYSDTSYVYDDDNAETKRTYKAMPYFKLGLDAKILKWLDFRAGVTSMWNQYKYEREYTQNFPAGDESYSYSYGETFTTTQTFLGVGMHWGALEIDALLDPEFLLNGPYFIGGEATDNNYNSNSMFGKVSFTYSL